jgi:hypothetical protein
MSRSFAGSTVTFLWCTAVLGGCGGVSQLGTPVASYGAANILMPAGYAQTKIDDTHFKVGATGTEATPKERVEKIARARAAQIGVDEKLGYFKVTNVQHGVKCEKRQAGYKSAPTPAASRPTVVLDVVYAKEAADPTFTSSAETFQALSAELAGEVVSPEAKAAAIQATRAGCGQG